MHNLVTNIQQCAISLPLMINVNLLYYSHISTMIISLLFGFFIIIKNKGSLVARVLFSITVTFSFWVLFNLLAWISFDSRIIMITWSLLGLTDSLLSILVVYFVYVFIDKKDVSNIKKTIWILMILPIIVMTPTVLNLSGFFVSDCVALDNSFFNYIYYLEASVVAWIIFLVTKRYIKSGKEEKLKIILLSLGVLSFLILNYSTAYIADWVGNYSIEVYGLFGMTIFLGFLGYLIVQYEAFNIKLLKAQALMVSLAVLIGALFFYVNETGGRILIGINLALAIVFGYMLVKSVKKEVEQKEALEIANAEITERKDQLQKMSDSLAVANDQLMQLDRAKSDFFARASHDLRTPVTGIKGFISMIQDGSFGAVNDKQQDILKKTFNIAENMAVMVEDFLSAAKLESGVMQYDFAKCQIEDILQQAVDTLYPKSKDKGLYLEFKKPAENLPELFIDGSRIRESVSNLVDNAIKYTLKGGVSVRLEQAESSNYIAPKTSDSFEKNIPIKGPVARITITDSGIGIPKDGISLLFAKYSRGKDTTRLKAGGTGLGLYVGKGMIEDNGGKVWAESDGEGLGSRFIVELPINPPESVLEKGKRGAFDF